jgi:hypothetical protein
MKTMRYLKWMLVLFGLIGMTACRQDTPRFRIGVAQCSDDSWRHKMNDEILREAMFYNGVSVEIRSAGMITVSRRKMSIILWTKESIC